MRRDMQANNAERKGQDASSINGVREGTLADATAQAPIESNTSRTCGATAAAKKSAAKGQRRESVHRSGTPASLANGILEVTQPGAAERMTLRQKLGEVRRRIGYIQKRGYNERYDYNYVAAADIAGAVGDILAELGVVVI